MFEEGRKPINRILSGRVGLKRLILGCVLKTERFGGFGRTCIPQYVTFTWHFHERLTCSKGLRRPSFKLQNNCAFDDIDEPRS